MSKRAAENQLDCGTAKLHKSFAATAANTCTLAPGTQCHVAGLQKAQHHNGKHGKVGAFNPATGRYVVLLHTGESLALQPANIIADTLAAGAAPLPSSSATPEVSIAQKTSTARERDAQTENAQDVPAGCGTATVSRVLQLCDMVTAEELADPEEYRDILSDVRDECTRVGGDVASITIPRLDDLSVQPPALPPSVDAIGLVYVEFEDLDAAQKAHCALDGRTFGENRVSVFPYPESDYAQGVLTDVRVALAAADEPAVDEAPRRRTGVVRMWNADKGFGFVQESNGTDIFVHVRSLVAHASSAALDVGQCVSFMVEMQPDGRHQAVDVRDPGGELPVDEAAHQAALVAAQDHATVSVFSDTIQGHKPTNEDRFTNNVEGGCRRFGKWVAVYDGHGARLTRGLSSVARFSRAKLTSPYG